MTLIRERTKLILWKISPRLFKKLVRPFDGQEFSIGLYSGSSPFSLASRPCEFDPVITAEHVHDVPAAFTADPFIVRDAEQWYIFFEVYNLARFRGEIGVATSDDCIRWNYQRIVLSEPHHLAYPQIIRDGDSFYMIPDTPEQGVRLYRAKRFPFDWQLEAVLIADVGLLDSTVFQHGNLWWMISGHAPGSDGVTSTRLHFSEQLVGTWTEHPASPIVVDNPGRSRPAGSVFRHHDRTFWLSQDCSQVYGESVSAHEILELTPTIYRESATESSKLLGAGGSDWCAGGMHHACTQRLSDRVWIAAVDGWKTSTTNLRRYVMEKNPVICAVLYLAPL